MSEHNVYTVRHLIRQISPPILLTLAKPIIRSIRNILRNKSNSGTSANVQDLDVYWDPKMAEILETWGEKNVWKELPLLLVNCHGKILDIACGTGKTMEIVSNFPLEVHGCDISDLLIEKAIERGIPKDRLKVADATNMSYEDGAFDYAYSIGSLEHFTEEGIIKFLSECKRVVHNASFHQIPVSRSDTNHGWIKTFQSYHNNSVAWWLEKFQTVYTTVYVLDSTWEDERSVGKWFVCVNSETN